MFEEFGRRMCILARESPHAESSREEKAIYAVLMGVYTPRR